MRNDAGLTATYHGRTGIVLVGVLAGLVVFATPVLAQRRSGASGASHSSRTGHGHLAAPVRLPGFSVRMPGFATWDGLTHPEAWGGMGGSLGVRDIFDGRAGMQFVRPGAVGRSGIIGQPRMGGFTTLGTYGGRACITRLEPAGCGYARRMPLIGSAGIGHDHYLGRGAGHGDYGAFGYYSAPSYGGYYGTGYGSSHSGIFVGPGYFGDNYAPFYGHAGGYYPGPYGSSYYGSSYYGGSYFGGSYYGGGYYGGYVDGYDVGASGVEPGQTGAAAETGQGGIVYASPAAAARAGGAGGVGTPAAVRPVTGCAEVAVLLASSGSWTRVPVPLPALGADTPAGLGAVIGSALARGKPLVLNGFDGLRVMVPAGPDVKQAVVRPCPPPSPPGS